VRVSYDEALRRGWVDAKSVPKAAKPASRRGKREAEGDEQVELLDEFRARFPDVGALLIHIPNGGSRKNAFEGWRLKQQGVSAEDAVKRIDMSAHKDHYPPNANLGVNLLGVQRMYELLDGRR